MPSQAFLKLPMERQNMLIHAAIEEFSRVLLPDASINKIIQSIGMPRGSFYLYFKNKEELYFYIVNQYKAQVFDAIKRSLLENDGDLINSCIQIFDHVTSFCLTADNQMFFRNVFLNMDFRRENELYVEPNEDFKSHKEELFTLIDRTNLAFSSEDDLQDVIAIVMTLTMHTLVASFMHKVPLKRVRGRYINQLQLLKCGLYRKGSKEC